jgi:replicative DNA helicase
MAKTVKFNDAQPLQSTIDLMSSSIEETNVFPTGIHKFDKDLGGLAKGNMVSIAGDTGSMKTMISLWLCIKILKANPKFTCLYFEKEMPVKDIARRLAAYASCIPVNKLMDTSLKDNNKYVITQALAGDDEMRSVMERLKIVPNGNFSNVSDMYRYIDTYNCDIWCLDFLTQLGAEDTSSDFNRFTMAQASMLKNIISETDTMGIVLNQVKKNSVRGRTNKIPQLDDIEWSGAISQYSAYIFSTFFPSVYYGDSPNEYFYLYGLKNRHYRPITIPLMTNPAYCQFNEPTALEEPLMQNWLQGYITRAQETKKTWRQ